MTTITQNSVAVNSTIKPDNTAPISHSEELQGLLAPFFNNLSIFSKAVFFDKDGDSKKDVDETLIEPTATGLDISLGGAGNFYEYNSHMRKLYYLGVRGASKKTEVTDPIVVIEALKSGTPVYVPLNNIPLDFGL